MSENSTVFIRAEKINNFTIINNTFLRDRTLSAQAKGVFAYLLSLPCDWNLYLSELVKNFTNGKDSIRSIINELIAHGYLIRERLRKENGCYGGCKYYIIETPANSDAPDDKGTEKKIGDPYFPENFEKEDEEKEFKSEKPKTENQTWDNPSLQSTNNKQSTNNTNNISSQQINTANNIYSQKTDTTENTNSEEDNSMNNQTSLHQDHNVSAFTSGYHNDKSKTEFLQTRLDEANAEIEKLKQQLFQNKNCNIKFSKTDYQEVYDLHKTLRTELTSQGKITNSSLPYNHKLINSMLKKLFANPDLGKESVKKALCNAINDKWCVEKCNFELQSLLSEKVVTRELNKNYYTPYISTSSYTSSKKRGMSYDNQNFGEAF